MIYVNAFLVGGAICALSQMLIDRTRLTPARILSAYVVLGVVLVNVQKNFDFLQSVINGVAGGIGFTVAIVLFASIRERVDKADCPECFKGYPMALIAAGLLALAFMGFSGLSIF